MLSLAVNLDWQLHQLDVKNTFLNGELNEKMFMCQLLIKRYNLNNLKWLLYMLHLVDIMRTCMDFLICSHYYMPVYSLR